jgi:hypothetical protein
MMFAKLFFNTFIAFQIYAKSLPFYSIFRKPSWKYCIENTVQYFLKTDPNVIYKKLLANGIGLLVTLWQNS